MDTQYNRHRRGVGFCGVAPFIVSLVILPYLLGAAPDNRQFCDGSTSSLRGAAGARDCPCDGDMDGSGTVQFTDILAVIECALGNQPVPPATCDTADVNCDGTIDLCDASRVFCLFGGGTDCCTTGTVCGACCNEGTSFDPCIVVSEDFCGMFTSEGVYYGDETSCDPSPCGEFECETDADCDDSNPCTEDICEPPGFCENPDMPDGTACLDTVFCNGEEACHSGVCQPGTPPDCDDGLTCTIDTCNAVTDECESVPAECDNDGVCDSPCESMANCPDDCIPCPCDGDMDGSGTVTFTDILAVIECALGDQPVPPATCDTADVNCDGTIDLCDASRVFCLFGGGTDCCTTGTVCGACCNEGTSFDPCIVVSEDFCDMFTSEGVYYGDETSCDPSPCDAIECTSDEDCDDMVWCTDDSCVDYSCVYEDAAHCPDDGLFCTGEEFCNVSTAECDHTEPCPPGALCDEEEDVCVGFWPPLAEEACVPPTPCVEDVDCAVFSGDSGSVCITAGTVSTCYNPKNTYLSIRPNNSAAVAFRVVVSASEYFPGSVGVVGWVGEPFEAPEDPGVSVAHIVDAPVQREWVELVVHVGGCIIVPVATYEVRATTDGVNFTDPLVIETIARPSPAHWADCVGAMEGGAWTAPNGVVNFNDVTAAVHYFTSASTAPPLTTVDIEPEEPNAVLNFADIQQIVNAFQGAPYPFSDPANCP